MKVRLASLGMLPVVLAAILLFAAPAARAEFACVCRSMETPGCPKNADLPKEIAVPTATSQGEAMQKCPAICEAKVPGACNGGYIVTGSSNSPGNTSCPPGRVCLSNPINVKTVPELIANILKGAMGIVGALALLVFIYGGFLWLTSGGESAKIAAGKEAMKWAAIGLVVIFTSYGLVRFVFTTFTG